jgi:hypothetical protein
MQTIGRGAPTVESHESALWEVRRARFRWSWTSSREVGGVDEPQDGRGGRTSWDCVEFAVTARMPQG